MKVSRRKMEELLWVSGLHGPARSIYGATLGRQAALARSKMRDFYRSVIQSGQRVFDVGANVGVLSAVFASLGARVVALEPNADCVRHIQLSYADKQIEVIQAAVGAKNGIAVLNVADDRDVRSSIADDWIATMGAQDESYQGIWSRRNVVPILTLDCLVEHFGMPNFIKVDVEGFEEKVLSGLSAQPPLLSFEFTAAFLAPGLRCLDLEIFQPGSTFNFAYNRDWGYPTKFEENAWLEKNEIKKALLAVEGSDGQGDIFVRAPQAAAKRKSDRA
jgi:FkbM family methyltransferase